MKKPDRRQDPLLRAVINDSLSEHLPLEPDRRRNHTVRESIDQVAEGSRWDFVMEGAVGLSIGERGEFHYTPSAEFGAILLEMAYDHTLRKEER